MSERDIRKLLALVEKHLGKSWIEIGEWLRTVDANSLDAIEARLIAYDYAGVVAEVEAAAKQFAAEVTSQFHRAGQSESKWLNKALKDKAVRFEVTNDHAVQAAKANELELVSGLTEETRETMRAVIYDGQAAGLNPRSIARDIRDSITLTEQQARWVANYRRELRSGDFTKAMRRELHDRRSDKLLRRLRRDGGSLTETQEDALVERYRQAQIATRAEIVARFESARNVHTGMEEAGRQAIERGDVTADQLLKEWIHSGLSKNSRPDHQEMDERTVKFDDMFELPDGVRMKYPHDPAGGAKHNAGCKCTYATKLELAS